MTLPLALGPCVSAAELAATIRGIDWSSCAASVVGYGAMGRQYVAALQALGIRQLRVCSRSAASLQELQAQASIEVFSGGVERFVGHACPNELAIVATPTSLLEAATERLVALGFQRLLIEKPVSLWSRRIAALADRLEHQRIQAFCGYNRLAYPSFHEVRFRCAREGGVRSCLYSLTEMVKPDWPTRFPAEELARWGIANSIHVLSMAHGLIGLPLRWSGYRTGHLSWHPAGRVFVGSGVSEREIPFSYHGDWGSMGRWGIEVRSAQASYVLAPLERVSEKRTPTGAWEEVPIPCVAPSVKTGVVEEVAAALHPDVGAVVPLPSLREAASLTAFAEELFGYPATADHHG